MKRLIPLLIALLLPIAAQAAAILVWGDSMSSAYGMPSNEAWPSLLDQKLHSEGLPYQVINASLPGETTSSGLARLPTALAQHKPDIVVIALGIVDVLRKVPVDATQESVTGMVKLAQAANARVLLVAAPLPDTFCPTRQKQFQEIFQRAASAHRTAFSPLLSEANASQAGFLPDGIHLDAKSQPLILNSLWPALKTLLN